MENMIRVGLGVYIFNPERKLLLGLRKSKHGEGTWCPPGGHMEFGESNEQTALREVFEETGIKLKESDVSLVGVTNDFFAETNKHYITLHMQVDNFTATPRVMEPDKCEKWEWFDLNNLPQNMFLSNLNFFKTYGK